MRTFLSWRLVWRLGFLLLLDVVVRFDCSSV